LQTNQTPKELQNGGAYWPKGTNEKKTKNETVIGGMVWC
jgi:hypothetical protein